MLGMTSCSITRDLLVCFFFLLPFTYSDDDDILHMVSNTFVYKVVHNNYVVLGGDTCMLDLPAIACVNYWLIIIYIPLYFI